VSESRCISIYHESDIINARQQTRQMAKDAGLTIINQARIALVVSSMARLIRLGSSFSGRIVLNRIVEQNRSGVQVLWMMDHHGEIDPEINELKNSNMTMIVDEMDVQTSEEAGTCITAMIWAPMKKSTTG
jgi:hypothetical protein